MMALFNADCIRKIVLDRKMFGQLMDVDHLPHTLQAHLSFSKGCAETGGVELADEMLKLIGGVAGATAYSAANAKIYVGSDSTAEAASQTGVIATTNKAYAGMDSGYPSVSGRTIVFRASFDDASANFAWNEAAITNGSGAGAIAMNRKVSALGTKTTGTWTLQLTISLTSV